MVQFDRSLNLKSVSDVMIYSNNYYSDILLFMTPLVRDSLMQLRPL